VSGRAVEAPADVAAVLRRARSIAVLGAHDERARPASYVPDYLFHQGYRILPVNPGLAGRTLWGEPVRATLAELPLVPDMVDVFRRAEAVVDHLDELLALAARRDAEAAADPGGSRPALVVWLQLGIRNDAVAAALRRAGVDVVQDRCTFADHRAMRIGPVSAP
jgi:hypothetical protein